MATVKNVRKVAKLKTVFSLSENHPTALNEKLEKRRISRMWKLRVNFSTQIYNNLFSSDRLLYIIG